MNLWILTVAVCLLACTGVASAQDAPRPPQVGDPAPAFSATADDGTTWSSSDVVGTMNLVVYFYPAAMTGGCTKQACAYRDASDKLQAARTVVVGISGDAPENLAYFKQAHQLNFPLLSDEDGSIAKAFGVPVGEGAVIQRDIDGRSVDLKRGVTAKRWTFLIQTDGTIADIAQAVNAEADSSRILKLLSPSP